MSLSRKGYKETWRCDAHTCREEDSEAFAGQHAANSTSYYVFDEASNVPPKIFEVREGGLTDGEPMTFDFGNPTRNSGTFHEQATGKKKHRFIVRHIDSRTVAITNKLTLARWIEDYGLDSDFVKVRVLGQFPSTGNVQFMPTTEVRAAVERELPNPPDPYAPVVVGVDVARFGDDSSVIFTRVGVDCRSFPPQSFKKLDTVQLVGRIIEHLRMLKRIGMHVAAIFIDGGGIGGGVIDQLRALGYDITEINFGGGATDSRVYRYKGDEMWGSVRDALPRLCLPQGEVGFNLQRQLTQREFGYTTLGGKIHLETKKDMKARLGGDGASPDEADALVLTYAQEVAPSNLPHGRKAQGSTVDHEYDPLEQKW